MPLAGKTGSKTTRTEQSHTLSAFVCFVPFCLDPPFSILQLDETVFFRNFSEGAFAPAHGDLDWYQPATGWIVISLTQWAFGTNPAPYDGYAWLKSFDPVATIGKTVRLYYVDPAHSAAKVSAPDPTKFHHAVLWPQVLTIGHICEG